MKIKHSSRVHPRNEVKTFHVTSHVTSRFLTVFTVTTKMSSSNDTKFSTESGKVIMYYPDSVENSNEDLVEDSAQDYHAVVSASSSNIRGMTADMYDSSDLRTQIYKTPDMYVGTDVFVNREEWVYNFETGKPMLMEISVPPAVVQLFNEIVSNAIDCVIRSRNFGWTGRPGSKVSDPVIVINMDRHNITIKNYGTPIPIEKNKRGDMLIPTMVFGTLLSSSNYNGVRHGIGKNGYGAKTTNIFSTRFVVTAYDGERGKYYQQTWTNNMLSASEPIVEDIPIGSESSVEVSYDLDFKRFRYDPEAGYPDEVFLYFAKIVLGGSFSSKCPMSFNGVEFDYFHIKDYARLYFGDAVDTAVIHYELSDPETEEVRPRKLRDGKIAPTPVVKKGQPVRIVVPRVELLLLDPTVAPPGITVSFSNSLMTTDGGLHVDSVYTAVVPEIVSKVNTGEAKTVRAGKASKRKPVKPTAKSVRSAVAAKGSAKPKEKPKKQIKPADVRSQISMVISCHLLNPKFSSQTKSKLTSYELMDPNYPDDTERAKHMSALPITLDEKAFKVIFSWGLINRLKITLRAIQMSVLKESDGSKKKDIKLKKGFDANDAGTPKSKNCQLWIVEGSSAMGYAVSLISALGPSYRDTIGVIPIRGKLLNVRNAKPERMLGNAEITLIKKTLGLRENMDYTIEVNYNTLRYGSLMIMTDADPDGSHIKGLLQNMFEYLYPSLLERGFLLDYRTKFLKMSSGRQVYNFYTPYEFDVWKTNVANWKSWKPDYYKGLGTSEDIDIAEDSKNPKIIQFLNDPTSHKMFELTFNKANSDERKAWIEEWRLTKDKAFTLDSTMELSTFFRYEFITFILESLRRAIPRFADGLKRSQGQILWGVMKKWPKGSGEKYKVAQLSNYIATFVEYHHNEKCLAEAIISMARSFTGSNNVPLLKDQGQFGSRFEGGADASDPRYIYTSPSWFLKAIFNSEDLPILEYNEDDGLQVEPKEFLPKIPLILINGAQGVATAYSTNFMNYNPLDVIQWFLWRLSSGPLQGMVNPCDPITLVPWYRGFKGNIRLIRSAVDDDTTESEDGIEDEIMVGEEVADQALRTPELSASDDDSDASSDARPDASDSDSSSTNEAGAVSNKRVVYDRVEIRGVYEVDSKGKVKVTELPIGRWTINYLHWLEELQDLKELSVRDNSTKDKICFEISKMKHKPSYRSLNLIRRFKLSNMVLLDTDGVPQRFDNVEDYLEKFYVFRLDKYRVRKEYQIGEKERKLQVLDDKIRFIVEVVEGRIIVMKRSKKAIEADMIAKNIPVEILKSVMLYECTQDKINELIAKREDELAKLEAYRLVDPAMIWYNELVDLYTTVVKHKEYVRTYAPIVCQPGDTFEGDDVVDPKDKGKGKA